MKTVLIIEDDRVSRKIYRRQIETFTEGEWQVTECEAAQAGLDLCKETLFDCILLDYHLLDMDGIQFLQRLRHDSMHVVPIVMLTGEREEGLGRKALRSGAQDFLIKGTFNKELLRQCILNAIEKALLIKELEERRQLYNDLLEEVEASGLKDERLSTLLSIEIPSQGQALQPAAKQFDVLLIDDDQDDLLFFSELLEESKRSINITTCSTLQEGIRVIQTGEWDCVLLDYMLGQGTAADILNLWSVLPPMPVIIVSDTADFQLATQLLRDGVTDFVIKGDLTTDILWFRIDEAIKRHHLLLHGQKLNALKYEHALELRQARRIEAESDRPASLYQALMDQTDDFIFVVNAETGLVEEENASVRRLLGFGSDKEKAYTFYELDVQLASLDSWHQMIANVKHNLPHVYETELKSNMGHRTVVKLTVKPFEQEGDFKIMVVAHDISKQKRIEDELRHMARTDALTQIPNRRYLDEKLVEMWRLLVREKRPLSVIMMDVDYFKRYNDNAGHLMGDQCLKSIATRLKEVINRPQDFVARYGGEEFAILLPFTDQEGAQAIGERVRSEIEELQLIHPDSPISKYVTLSVGVATGYPSSEMQPTVLFELADQALYQAKENGRNTLETKGFDAGI